MIRAGLSVRGILAFAAYMYRTGRAWGLPRRIAARMAYGAVRLWWRDRA